MIEVAGRFHSKATDHVVAGANEIFDDEQNQKQSDINAENESFKEAQAELNEAQSDFNSEVREALGTGGTVDERIVNAVNTEKTRAEAAEEALDGRVDTLEEAVGTGGSVDSRISSVVATETTRAQEAEEQLRQAYEDITQSGVIPVAEEDWPLAELEEGVIYRVAGTTSYADYMYNGTDTIKMAEYNNAIDDTPTAGSDNLVKSGGVAEQISQLGQYVNEFNALVKHKGWIGASAYSYVESGNATHVVVPCNAGEHIHIKANDSFACLFYVVKSYTVPETDGETPDFVSGEDTRQVVQNTQTLDFTAPVGTKYLVVGYQLNDDIYTPAEFIINGYNVLENIREAICKNTSEIAHNAESLKETTFGVYGGKFTLNITGTYSAVPLGEIVPKGCVLTDIGAFAGDLWLVDTQSNNHRVRGVPFVLTTDISGVIVSTAGNISLTFSAINDAFNTVSEYKSEDFVFGYYNTGSVSIGDYLPEFRTYENIATLMISVKAGDIITSKFQNNNSNEYCRGWILTDKDKKILSWSAEGSLDYLTNPLEQVITTDGYLIVQHQPVTSLSSVLISQYRRVINLNETIKDESKKAVQDYIEEQGISKDTVQICLPDKIYAVAGDKLQLFYRGFIKAVVPYNYDIKITCSVGQQFPRYYQYAPAASASNRTDDLLVQIKNNAGKILAEKTIQIITCSTPVSPDSQKHVLIFGDSLTAKGQWAAETYRRLVGNGGSPAGKQLSNISFNGAMVKDGAGYLGIGGWTWNDYETNISGFRFQVSGVTALNNGDSYTCNGSTFTLVENNTTDGVGEIMMIRIAGSTSPDISGSLQRVSGVGDETINYSSWSEDVGNPLWDSDNNKMSFVPYANLYSDGKIDVVYVLLGGNSVQAWQTNFDAMKTAIIKFVDTLHSEFPNAKCKIVGLEIPSVRGGAGGNIATGVRLSDQYGMTNGVMNMNMFYQEFANSSETSGTSGDAYNTFVEYVDIASQFDTEYNMPHEMVDVNSRNSVDKEWRDTNQLHPADCGYMQIADSVYRNFVANFCQTPN